MQAEAIRVWQALAGERARLQGALIRDHHEFKKQLVVGEFAATIDTVENTDDPVIMTASAPFL